MKVFLGHIKHALVGPPTTMLEYGKFLGADTKRLERHQGMVDEVITRMSELNVEDPRACFRVDWDSVRDKAIFGMSKNWSFGDSRCRQVLSDCSGPGLRCY